MAITGLLTTAQLAQQIAGTPNTVPPPPAGITDKSRWQTVTVVNQTQFTLGPGTTYFDSGRFWTAPAQVPAFSEMTFSVCDSDGSIMTGATGAITLQMALDPAGGLACNVGVGFDTPWLGTYGSNVLFDAGGGVAPNSPPVLSPGALAQSTEEGNTSPSISNVSTQFSGTDTNGQPTTISFTGTATAGQQAVVVITQQIVSGGS